MKKWKYILMSAALLLSGTGVFAGCAGGTNAADATKSGSNGTGKPSEVTETDADGNVTKLTRYDKKGDLVYTHVSTWGNGRLVHKTAYDAAGREIGSYDYTYDERGNNLTGAWYSTTNGILMPTESVYNELDQRIEHTRIGAGSIATNKTFYTYDEKGRVVEEKYYDSWPDGEVTFTSYEYNDLDQKVRLYAKDGSGNLLYSEANEWTDFGKLSQYAHYNADGTLSYTIKYFYDADQNKIREERYDGDGNLVNTTLY